MALYFGMECFLFSLVTWAHHHNGNQDGALLWSHPTLCQSRSLLRLSKVSLANVNWEAKIMCDLSLRGPLHADGYLHVTKCTC